MNRYETPEWLALVEAQNTPKNENTDILTITAFMNEEQFKEHVKRYTV